MARTAVVVAAHDDVLDLEVVHGVLQAAHAVEVLHADHVAHVAVHKHLPGLQLHDHVRLDHTETILAHMLLPEEHHVAAGGAGCHCRHVVKSLQLCRAELTTACPSGVSQKRGLTGTRESAQPMYR